jgi:hypothetical protein
MFKKTVRAAVVAVMPATLAAGCLVIGATEHRVRFNDDGGGEARLRLVDIRSDGETDSAVTRDFAIMMSSFEEDGVQDFERGGRRVRTKRFQVHGDTLSAEVIYSFTAPQEIEGLVVTHEEKYVVVGEGRIIVSTNGKIKLWGAGGTRIVWPGDARRLQYVIREDLLPPSVSLARLYQRYRK